MKILTSKRFWGLVIAGIGTALQFMNVPFADLIITAGGTLATAGLVDATKPERKQ